MLVCPRIRSVWSLSAIAFLSTSCGERPPGRVDGGGPRAPGCIGARGRPPGRALHSLDDGGGVRAEVSLRGAGCQRVFELASTAPRRDHLPHGPRTIRERPEDPSIDTRNPLFDALYALARAEAREASVDRIRDDGFFDGQPIPCGDHAGCFETGRLWTYVWTRDTSYAADLALASVDPARARMSLEFKLSERRAGGDLQIVQDTGTGGSYPMSTDRVVWAMGAGRLLDYLNGEERDAFAFRAATAMANTIDQDRALVFDPRDGLYRGETSFLDWREQSYPVWTARDTVHIGMSRALSTNLGHLAILEAAAALHARGGDPERVERYRGWAIQLRDAIRDRFAVADTPLLSSFIPTGLDPAPARRFDLLGSALAVTSGVVSGASARALVAAYPHLPYGPPVIWPQEAGIPIYHNRAIWPFVTAYWLRAARLVRNDAAVNHGVRSLMRGAALNLSHMENLEVHGGRAWLDDGALSGPVVNSQRQLWSVAGYLSMVHDVLFGLETSPDGIRFAPYLTRAMRRELFAAADALVLRRFAYRGARITVVIELPPPGEGAGAYTVGRALLDGRPVGAGFLPPGRFGPDSLLRIQLVDTAEAGQSITRVADPSDRESIYAPHTPVVTAVEAIGGQLGVSLEVAGELPDRLTWRLFRDGETVAGAVEVSAPSGGEPGRWRGRWSDAGARPGGPSHCYTAEVTYRSSGNTSHRARPVCWAGRRGERQRTVRLDRRGQAEFLARASGPHRLALVYRNPGPVNTGVTCAVRRLEVIDIASERPVGAGYPVLPHTDPGGEPSAGAGAGADPPSGRSSIVAVDLVGGRRYRVLVAEDARTVNMSAFRHFERYTGGAGGREGARNTAEISAVEVFAAR